METAAFNVPSIMCNVCAGKIKDGVSAMSGIGNVSVDIKTKMVEVDYNPSEIQPRDISRKLSSLGFEVTH